MAVSKGNHTVVIIGVGSPFGTDQIGWLAVDWLQRSDLQKDFADLQLYFTKADRPGALLLERLHGMDGAIIIDAMQAGLPPGDLRTFTPDQLFTQQTALVSSHAFGVAEALALAASLGELPWRMTIIGIEMGIDTHEMRLPESTTRQLMPPIKEFLISLQRPRSAE